MIPSIQWSEYHFINSEVKVFLGQFTIVIYMNSQGKKNDIKSKSPDCNFRHFWVHVNIKQTPDRQTVYRKQQKQPNKHDEQILYNNDDKQTLNYLVDSSIDTQTLTQRIYLQKLCC